MPLKPMLAGKVEDVNALRYPVLASPKLDGVRAMVQNGVLVSRNWRPIACVAARAKFGALDYEGLDGELTEGAPNGKDVFNKTVRVTQKRDAMAGKKKFSANPTPSFNAPASAAGGKSIADLTRQIAAMNTKIDTMLKILTDGGTEEE